MGRYELILLKEKDVLMLSQIQALSEYVTITKDRGMFQVLIDEEKPVVLFEKMSPYVVKIVDHYITASNVKWKKDFRSTLRKNKIKFRSRSFD